MNWPQIRKGQSETEIIYMKRRITTLILIAMLSITSVMFTACGSGPVGFWQVDKVESGTVTMTKDDAAEIGLNAVGTIKLQKSGNCVVVLIGEEYEGTWTQSDDGEIVINYDEDKELRGTITDGTMTLTDEQGSLYTLSK